MSENVSFWSHQQLIWTFLFLRLQCFCWKASDLFRFRFVIMWYSIRFTAELRYSSVRSCSLVGAKRWRCWLLLWTDASSPGLKKFVSAHVCLFWSQYVRQFEATSCKNWNQSLKTLVSCRLQSKETTGRRLHRSGHEELKHPEGSSLWTLKACSLKVLL